MPHAIEKSPRGGELTIGGLPVSYGVDGVEWTRAMKYMLTNIKQLLIYRSFGLWILVECLTPKTRGRYCKLVYSL
jgi:hypothetical protein